MDELDRSDVRERLEHVRRNQLWKERIRQEAMDALRQIAARPLGEGQTPKPANYHIDAFGRGPGSPFYQPDFRPPWAPSWIPGHHAYIDYPDGTQERLESDDGIEWRVI